MKNLSRRNFLKTAAIGASAVTLGAASVKAAEKTNIKSKEIGAIKLFLPNLIMVP